jgi:hypothetical protein
LSTRIFYPMLALSVSPSPATGFMSNTGFNGVYTGLGSGGNNLIQNLERLQSITNGFSQDRTVVNQIGQLAFLSREITTPPTVNLGGSYYVADLSNERILGFYVSGNQSALTNILNQSQATKNYFITIAPQGQDNVGWTGQRQVELISNGQLASWSTEGSVGNIPTTTFAVQGLNYANYTGSTNQRLFAIDVGNNGNYVTDKYFTIPTVVSGMAPTVAALRPNDITLDISQAAFGVNISDLKAQSYSISFDLNVQPLTKLGSLFPYAIEPQFPVTLSASASFYLGDLVTGSYRDVLCNDNPYNIRVTLNDPCGGGEAVAYELRGVKVDSQTFDSQDIGSVAAVMNVSWSTQLGGPNDQNSNFFMSGRNI